MPNSFKQSPRIAVIGLGYVGLPLAVTLALYFPTTGFDIDEARIEQLKKGFDRTNEISSERLRQSALYTTAFVKDLAEHDLFIVTVPTPVTLDHTPDLRALESACRLIGPFLRPKNIVVFESTVYPGVSEEICGPILEAFSGLKAGKDFYLGYSPERINPGDKQHCVDQMVKVVAGQNEEVASYLKYIYGYINGGKIFVARSIAVAEAAKVIENAQRDINVAFINEVATILSKAGLSIHDVLETSATKWNFLPFHPGLVGGHCIGVDPYYLSYFAKNLGIEPKIILAGRNVNESMGSFLADHLVPHLKAHQKILILGLTFKEDIPDLRNTKVIDFIQRLQASLPLDIHVHDPLASPVEAKILYDISLEESIENNAPYDAIFSVVAHTPYQKFNPEDLCALLKPGGLIADIKGMWRKKDWPKHIHYWTL